MKKWDFSTDESRVESEINVMFFLDNSKHRFQRNFMSPRELCHAQDGIKYRLCEERLICPQIS